MLWFLVEHLLTIAGFLLAVVLILQLIREHRRPSGTLAWMLAIVLIPYVGVPLYLLIGGRKLHAKVKRKGDLYAAAAAPVDREPYNKSERALCAGGMPPAQGGNRITLNHSGESAYQELIAMIGRATDSIEVTTFILGRDIVGETIVERLAQKARDGVRVRLLLDSLGCMWITRRFLQPLRDAGGEVGFFLPVLPLQRRWSANLRNHRKIVVVDGRYAMLGGMNLSMLFMGPFPHPKRFVDSAAFIEGPAVQDVRRVFEKDWNYAAHGGEVPELEDLPLAKPGEAVVQVAASGPDVPDDVLHDALLTAIFEARERIWILTPYFVPDQTMVEALALQARMGVDVRILVPRRSNHRLADLARVPALRKLRDSGARIYAYRKGMIHAKLLVFDHYAAVTGSPNLDMRSMYLNFEIALFHYSAGEIEDVAQRIATLIASSEEHRFSPPTVLDSFREGIGTLLSPLL